MSYLAREGNEIIRGGSKWSPELASACERLVDFFPFSCSLVLLSFDMILQDFVCKFYRDGPGFVKCPCFALTGTLVRVWCLIERLYSREGLGNYYRYHHTMYQLSRLNFSLVLLLL